MTRILILPLIAAFLSLAPQAQAARDLGKDLALAFVGSCLLALPDLDGIEAAAKEKKWEPQEGDALKLLTQNAPDPALKGWLVDLAPIPPHFISITSAKFRGDDMMVCRLTNPYAPVTAIFPHLKIALGLNAPDKDDISAGQRKRVWQIEFRRQTTFVTLSDSEPMGQNGFTISGMMKAKE